VFDDMLLAQLSKHTRKRIKQDPVTGEAYDLGERHPLDPRNR
jgi:hypothetical protein